MLGGQEQGETLAKASNFGTAATARGKKKKKKKRHRNDYFEKNPRRKERDDYR